MATKAAAAAGVVIYGERLSRRRRRKKVIIVITGEQHKRAHGHSHIEWWSVVLPFEPSYRESTLIYSQQSVSHKNLTTNC